jgi:hypothetical protein
MERAIADIIGRQHEISPGKITIIGKSKQRSNTVWHFTHVYNNIITAFDLPEKRVRVKVLGSRKGEGENRL